MVLRSVLIADSNSRLSQLVGQLLADEPGFRVVGVHGTAEAMLRAAGECRPDVVLLSDRLEGRPVGPLCERLRQLTPATALVMWAHDPTSRDEGRAVADAVVERGMTFRELVRDLRAVMEPGGRPPPQAGEAAVPVTPQDRATRGLLDDPESAGGLLLNCDSCAVQVRIATDDVAPAVEEARGFFADHSQCDTGIDLRERPVLTLRT